MPRPENAQPAGNGLPPLPAHLDPRRHGRGGPGGRGNRAFPALITVKVLAALLSAALLLFAFYSWKSYRTFDKGLRRLSIDTGTHQQGHHDIDGKDQNILIVGNDDRTNMTNAEVKALKTGRDGGSLATDTMMIVHVPADGTKATLISLPRDSYVTIAGYGMNKLNSAYASGYAHSTGTLDAKRAAGANLLIKTITNLTGLTIDHFVQVDLLGFYRISNAIGGVPINLCHAVNDPLYSHLVLSAGKHSISGVTALEFVRQRHGLPNGDLDRTARQRYFLTAAFRQIASAGTLLSPGKLNNLISAVDKSIYVDASFKITSLAGQMANLSANNIVGKAIPFVRFDTVDPFGSVEIIDPGQVKAFVNKLIGGGDKALASAKPVDPSTVTVAVRNWGTTNGAASTNARALSNAGFHATVDSTSGSLPATTIHYAAGMEAQAKTLAQYVPGAVLQKSDVKVLTLVLGTDGLTAHAKAAVTSTAPKPSPSTNKPKALDSGCIN